MHTLVSRSAWRLAAMPVVLALGLAACSGGSTPAPAQTNGSGASSGTGGSGGGAASPAGGSGGSPGATTVTGSLVSSGLYSATWAWQPGNAADVGTGGVTMNSDKGTFGSITVLADGTITFTSGAPELKSGSYKGTGAQVHMKDASGTQLPCGWTLDNDVTGTDGVIHLKGTMDIIGTVWECPG
jgi:hypothetical protein